MAISHSFAGFLTCILHYKHFEKQDNHHSLCISEIKDCETRG